MKTNSKLLICIYTLWSLSTNAIAQTSETKSAVAQEAFSGLISLFDQTPLVALGETHEHLQLYDFLTTLVQTEGFYTQVNDILIESGSALYQETLDQYISGEDVSMMELQKVWLNTTQSPVDPWGSEVYYNFLKTIRVLNSQIASEYQIRVIAADPAIQWEEINTLEEYNTARGSRNTFYAQMAINEVLRKKRKALMISGGAHFGYHNPRKTLINQRIEKVYPNSVTVVLATSGLGRANAAHEGKLMDWHRPTLTKLEGTWIGQLPGPSRRMRTAPAPTSDSNTSNASATLVASPAPAPSASKKQDFSDYLLYFGTPNEIEYGKVDASIYESDELWQEMNRRSKVRFNHELLPETRKTGSLRPVSYN